MTNIQIKIKSSTIWRLPINTMVLCHYARSVLCLKRTTGTKITSSCLIRYVHWRLLTVCNVVVVSLLLDLFHTKSAAVLTWFPVALECEGGGVNARSCRVTAPRSDFISKTTNSIIPCATVVSQCYKPQPSRLFKHSWNHAYMPVFAVRRLLLHRS